MAGITEFIIDFVAAISAAVYALFLLGSTERNYLRRCLAAAFICVSAIFFLRASLALGGGPVVESLVVAPVMALPLTLLLAAEAFRRQHSHVLAKLIAVSGALFGLVLAIGGWWRSIPYFPIGLAVYVLTGLLASAAWVAARDRAGLPVQHNETAGFFVAALLVATPFAATDFQAIIVLPIQLGAIATLICLYFAVWLPSPGTGIVNVALQLAGILLAALLLGLFTRVLVPNSDPASFLAASAIAFCVILAAALAAKLGFDHQLGKRRRFLDAFVATDKRSMDGFIEHCATIEPFTDALLMGEAELADFDHARIEQALVDKKVIDRPYLSRVAASDLAQDLREQCLDLLDRVGAGYMCRVGHGPLRIALFRTGSMVDHREISARVQLLAETAQLILERRGGDDHAA